MPSRKRAHKAIWFQANIVKARTKAIVYLPLPSVTSCEHQHETDFHVVCGKGRTESDDRAGTEITSSFFRPDMAQRRKAVHHCEAQPRDTLFRLRCGPTGHLNVHDDGVERLAHSWLPQRGRLSDLV